MLLNENCYPAKFKSFQPGKLFKWEPCKSCKILYKPLWFNGLSTQSIQTLYFGWYKKSYHFAIFRLQILLFVVKTLRFSWSFIWIEYLSFSKQTGKQPYSFLQWPIRAKEIRFPERIGLNTVNFRQIIFSVINVLLLLDHTCNLHVVFLRRRAQ